MNIGILTQPLHDNYGGLLQAYALKTTLEKFGHKVTIVNRRSNNHNLLVRFKAALKQLIKGTSNFQLTASQKAIISRNTNYFSKTYIKDITPPIFDTGNLKKYGQHFDLFFIGSDQVWRPIYSPKITNYFLDFVDNPNVRGIAYAASFGVDNWEYTAEDTAACKANIHKIKAISVREDSAVALCRDHLGVDAVHVVDPTLLLKPEDYITLIENEREPDVQGELMHYVLDNNTHKEQLIQYIAGAFDYKVFSPHQKEKPTKESVRNIENCVFPTVTAWLNGFKSAKFIVTDSFHGTVFSILFNKPFLVIANNKRGKARFESLLKMFNLEDRLVTDPNLFQKESVNDLFNVDWATVNATLGKRRTDALKFITDNL